MRFFRYLLIAVLLLDPCGSVFGQELPKVTPEEVKEIIREAEQGDAEAQTALGAMYYESLGVPKDYQLALKWHRRAAEQGDAHGQFSLGGMYALGKGVPQDYVLAHKWFNLCAAQGDKDAAKWRDKTAKKMTPSQIAEAQKLSRNFKPKKENP